MDAEEAEATCHCAWSPLTSLLLVLQLVLALVHALRVLQQLLAAHAEHVGQIQAQLGVLLQLAMQRQRSQRVQALLAQRRVEVGYTCHGGALVFF